MGAVGVNVARQNPNFEFVDVISNG
jgi:hypothetical protein